MKWSIALVVCAACSNASSPSMTFGVTGPWKEGYGLMSRRGAELAQVEINALPERSGHPLALKYADDEGLGERATQVAQAFVDSADVLAVIGHVTSSPAVAAAQVYHGHLAAVATSATTPNLTGISPWTFRVVASDSANGVALARFVERLGRKRAALMYENDSYGRGLSGAFRKEFKGTIVAIDPITDSGDQVMEPFVTYYRQQRVDVIVGATNDPSARALLHEVRRQKFDVTLAGGDGWSGLRVDTVLADGVYSGVHFSLEHARADAMAFDRAFTARFGVHPDDNAALAYDVTKLLYEAARHGASREAIRDYLARIDERSPFIGITGPISFHADGDPVGRTMIMTHLERGVQVVVGGGDERARTR